MSRDKAKEELISNIRDQSEARLGDLVTVMDKNFIGALEVGYINDERFLENPLRFRRFKNYQTAGNR